MNSGRNDCRRVSRRGVLTGTALALGAAAAAAVVSQATAQEKLSQADAKYQGTLKGDQRCDGCVLFQPLNACKVVQGEINPSGWCSCSSRRPSPTHPRHFLRSHSGHPHLAALRRFHAADQHRRKIALMQSAHRLPCAPPIEVCSPPRGGQLRTVPIGGSTVFQVLM
jgi:hypothetical protein